MTPALTPLFGTTRSGQASANENLTPDRIRRRRPLLWLIAPFCGWSGYLRLTSPHADMYDGNDLTRQTVKMWGAFLDARWVFTRISREDARM